MNWCLCLMSFRDADECRSIIYSDNLIHSSIKNKNKRKIALNFFAVLLYFYTFATE